MSSYSAYIVLVNIIGVYAERGGEACTSLSRAIDKFFGQQPATKNEKRNNFVVFILLNQKK